MISVQGVTKRFGRQVVLDDVSIEIEQGKTTAVVGPSGVGKSVLLKLILGILQPDKGQIIVGGKNITAARSESDKNAVRQSVGVLFQGAALFDSLSVYENVAFSLRQRGDLLQMKLHRSVCEMLEALSLSEYARMFPQEVSIGVRKRVGLARALISRPSVLLVDEPNTGLDPLDGQEVYDLIKECKQRFAFTGLVISHELPEVFQVSDRVEMLLGGKVIAGGTPAQFLESDNPAVFQFLKGLVDGPIRIQ